MSGGGTAITISIGFRISLVITIALIDGVLRHGGMKANLEEGKASSINLTRMRGLIEEYGDDHRGKQVITSSIHIAAASAICREDTTPITINNISYISIRLISAHARPRRTNADWANEEMTTLTPTTATDIISPASITINVADHLRSMAIMGGDDCSTGNGRNLPTNPVRSVDVDGIHEELKGNVAWKVITATMTINVPINDIFTRLISAHTVLGRTTAEVILEMMAMMAMRMVQGAPATNLSMRKGASLGLSRPRAVGPSCSSNYVRRALILHARPLRRQ